MNGPQVGPNIIHVHVHMHNIYYGNYICNTIHMCFTIHRLLMSVCVGVIHSQSNIFDWNMLT